MCGILCIISNIKWNSFTKNFCMLDFYTNFNNFQVQKNESLNENVFQMDSSLNNDEIESIIKNTNKRGPDHQHNINFPLVSTTINNEKNIPELTIFSSVLSLRKNNNKIQSQPVINYVSGSTFSYNGEVWGVDEAKLIDFKIKYSNILSSEFFNKFDNFDFSINDTIQLYELISQIEIFIFNKNYDNFFAILSDFLNVFEAEFSFILFSKISNSLIISKDFFGKKSLLLSFTKNGFIFHSTGISTNNKTLISLKDDDFNKPMDVKSKYSYYSDLMKNKNTYELPNNSIFIIDFNSMNIFHHVLNQQLQFNQSKIFVQDSNPFKILEIKENKQTFKRKLLDSLLNILNTSIISMINDRIISGEPISVLFSGGLDSSLIVYFILSNFQVT